MKKFTLTLKQEQVQIDEKVFTVRELNGQQRDKYLNKQGVRMQFNAAGKPTGLKDFTGIQSDLLTECLFDPDGKAVTAEMLKTWPASLCQELFDLARELSNLGKGQVAAEEDQPAKTEPAKNE